MIRRLSIVVAFVCCAFSAAAQESGDKIGVTDFQQIDAKGNIELIIYPSDSASTVTVEYFNITQRDFHHQVRKGVLYLDVPSGLLVPQGFARVTVRTPQLQRIKSEGATIECRTPIKGDFFQYTTQGSVNMAILEVEVSRLVIKISGKSDVMVTGSATEAEFSAKVSSRIDAFRLSSEVASAQCYDGSEIYVCPTKSLKAKASMAGTIYYMNTPTVEPKVSLWGDVVLIERAKYRPIFPNAVASSAPKQVESAKPKEVKEQKPEDKVEKQQPAAKPAERKVEKKSTKKQQEPNVEPATSSSSDSDFF